MRPNTADLPRSDSAADSMRRGAVLVAAAALALASCSRAPAPAVPDVPVSLATAQRGNEPIAVTGLGQVSGFYTASARAQTSGLIVGVSFTEGQAVRAGQPLALIDPRPLQAALAQSRAALARDEAALAGARDLLDRNAPLVAQGLASAQQVEAYRAQVRQLVASLAGDRAQIERDRLNLDYATIRAPIDGVAGIRAVDPGNLVSPTDPTGIVTIAQVQPITVVFTVSQKMLPGIQAAIAKAGAAPLRVEAVAPGSSTILDAGRLSVLNNQVDSGTGTLRLKAVFPNAARRLWPGQQVTARLILGTADGAVTVPSSAIQRSPSSTFLWIAGPDARVRMQAVTLGETIGDRIVVRSGLKGGERVVTDGQFALTPGRRVAADRSAPIKADNPDQLGLSL